MATVRVEKFDVFKSSNGKEIQAFLDTNNITASMVIKIVTLPRSDDALTILIFWTPEALVPTEVDIAFEETESKASRVVTDVRIGTEDDGVNAGKIIFRTGIVVENE